MQYIIIIIINPVKVLWSGHRNGVQIKPEQ